VAEQPKALLDAAAALCVVDAVEIADPGFINIRLSPLPSRNRA
jgi:arginyl-tRNA synthetase